MRIFNEEDISLFDSLIAQGESILKLYEEKEVETLAKDKAFNDEYDQWRADVFRLFETHFDFRKDIVFHEVVKYYMWIMQQRSSKYVEIILRPMRSCYRIPYHKPVTEKTNADSPAVSPVNINIHNENSQSQNQSQEFRQFVDLLKNSLAPYQYEELKEIAVADEPVPEKRKKLLEKILSFGSNVGSSVLANILTHPEVFGLL